MPKRMGSFRKKTRHKLAKYERGKISIKKYLQKLNLGDKVCLKAEPAIQHGMYNPRFHGKFGTVVGKQGDCYIIQLMDKHKEKSFIVHPVHLEKR